MRRIGLIILSLLVFLSPVLGGDHWPQFRGGSRANVSDAKTLPGKWSTSENVVWKIDLPGRGWSSPISWGDRIYVTTVTSDARLPEPRKGLYIADLAGKIQPGEHRWLVCCIDRKTGKMIWQKEAHKGRPVSPIHIKNTYSSETPATNGERVYAYFGNIGVFCFDRDGKEVWSKKMPPVPTRFGWGTAASPALYKDHLFIVNDNEDKSYLLALGAKNGKELWRVERDEKSNWTSPYVWENELRTEVITAGSNKVRSYSLDGKLLWELKGMSVIAIPTPFARDGLLYVASGYVLDGNRPVYAIRPGAKGDISLKDGQTKNDFIVWAQRLAGPYHPTPLVYGDFLYVLYDRGYLACFNAKTGEQVYDKQRLGRGEGFTSSPWAYDGKIFCLSEDGNTFVVKAGPKFELLGKNSLEEMSMATPALAGGSLIVRTMGKLYRIEKTEK